MIVTYLKHKEKVIKSNEVVLDTSTLWIDLIDMSRKEESLVEDFLGIDVPSKDEMEQLEISNRLYTDDDAIYVIVTFTNKQLKLLANRSVTFILCKDKLITVRYDNDLHPFNSFISRLEKGLKKNYGAEEIYLAILGSIVEMVADIIQEVRQNINELSKKIFSTDKYSGLKESKSSYKNHIDILKNIGHQGNTISKTEESILSVSRAVNYSLRSDRFSKQQAGKLSTMLADLNAIAEHTAFLSGEAGFLLSAFLGIIEIEQSKIVKLVSIISLVFLPPTLIASIYGMNFELMPELRFRFGYPLTLIFMLIAGWLPYKICKKKNWL